MPKHRPESSTVRRHKLASFIDSFGTAMVKPCSTCAKHHRLCKVHVRSGKCSECLRRGQRCDLKVTQSEWDRLKSEKLKLKQRIEEARVEQEEAVVAEARAREARRVAFAREMRLRQQMDLIDNRAAEAIAVEERSIEELELEEQNGVLDFAGPSAGLGLNLSPGTWSALDGFPDEFWDLPLEIPSSQPEVAS